jgi:deoxyribodipyrimidine photo-lyase
LIRSGFVAEEKLAIAQLRQFCQQAAREYEQQRDFPAVDGTSRLSASLATGDYHRASA